jgi:hypothetical protein
MVLVGRARQISVGVVDLARVPQNIALHDYRGIARQIPPLTLKSVVRISATVIGGVELALQVILARHNGTLLDRQAGFLVESRLSTCAGVKVANVFVVYVVLPFSIPAQKDSTHRERCQDDRLQGPQPNAHGVSSRRELQLKTFLCKQTTKPPLGMRDERETWGQRGKPGDSRKLGDSVCKLMSTSQLRKNRDQDVRMPPNRRQVPHHISDQSADFIYCRADLALRTENSKPPAKGGAKRQTVRPLSGDRSKRTDNDPTWVADSPKPAL